jgi:glycine/D-amino acid oxidase-like deaminating enzyme
MANGAGEMNVPVWADSGTDPELRGPTFPRLTSAIDADVCVIGLGGSGLACIGELLAAGVAPARIVGLDAGIVAGGAAGRNGGFLLAGTADFYHDAVAQFGRDRARRLYALTIAQIETMARETPRAVRRSGSLRIAASEDERRDCEAHLEALRADSFPAEPYTGPEGEGLLVPTDCAFDPLLRCRTLACRASDAGVRLFEHSAVARLEPGLVVTTTGAQVRSRHVIVAVDGGLARLVPELAARARPVRLQMLATAPTREIQVPRPVYARWGYDYWQQLGNGRLVIGGFRDAAGDAEWTTEAAPSERIQRLLEEFVRETLGVRAPITHRWAATVSYSLNGLPVLEEVRPGVVATGAYSGTGNVMGALCGRAAARFTLGTDDEMFDLLSV